MKCTLDVRWFPSQTEMLQSKNIFSQAFCCIDLMFCYVFLQINYIACIVDFRICMDANNKDCLHKIIIKHEKTLRKLDKYRFHL